jgi:hypothetical protein
MSFNLLSLKNSVFKTELAPKTLEYFQYWELLGNIIVI